MAPEAILRAALRVLYVAAYTTRNWTLSEEVSRRQINDLWEAIHEIPALLARWRPDAEDELLRYLDEYESKWPSPQLRAIYQEELQRGPGELHPSPPMSEDDVFVQTKGAYLCLIHPLQLPGIWQELAPVIALAPSAPDPLIASLITGASWRERLLGLCMAMAKGPETFIDAMLQSLRDLRGIAIVPACAALAVLARRGVFAMPESFAEMFDRAAFDGEVGWAVDKAMHFAGLRADDVPGHGPNYGQVFEDHVKVYSFILAG